MQIYKEFFFEAAHFLPSAKKGTPNSRIHGHSFRVRLTLEGQPDPETGLILHFEKIAEKIEALKEKLDHRLLNEIDGLDFPTLEHLSMFIWNNIIDTLPSLIEVQVSRDTCMEGCIYRGSQA